MRSQIVVNMQLSQYIINDIKPLSVLSELSELKLFFNELTYSHIPIQNENNQYLGCLSETDVHCFETDKTVKDCAYAIEGFHVRDTTNWLDVLEAFAQNYANIMPVLDKNNNYLGYYELNDIINLFNDTPFFAEAGAIIVIEKGANDYSFSEITQIVESNDAKLYGIFISNLTSESVQITIKIGHSALNDVIQTLRRYSYKIVSGHEEDTYIENLKERSDYLNKYLNM